MEGGWGEQLVGRVEPAVFVLDIADGRVTRVAGLAEHGVAASGPVWAPRRRRTRSIPTRWCARRGGPTSITSTTRRAGSGWCSASTVRPRRTWRTSLWIRQRDHKVSPPVLLTRTSRSALWPRFSPDGDVLVWFSHERARGDRRALRHRGAVRDALARARERRRGGRRRRGEPRPRWSPSSTLPSRPGGFGVVRVSSPPPNDPWLPPDGRSRGARMVLQTTWGAGEAIVEVNVATGTARRMTPAPGDGGGSWTLCDAKDGVVAAIEATRVRFPACASRGGTHPRTLTWTGTWTRTRRGTRTSISAGLDAARGRRSCRALPVDDRVGCGAGCVRKPHASRHVEVRPGEVESVVVRSRSAVASGERLPTIVLPHGGPHANCGAAYVTSTAYLASLGYAVCYCNYRGSTGYGDARCRAWWAAPPGARTWTTASPSPNAPLKTRRRPNAFVGGREPRRFSRRASRGPATGSVPMRGASQPGDGHRGDGALHDDIPDWCFVETLGREAYSDLPSPERWSRCASASPVRYVNEVAKHDRPVLMLLGGVDLRVPPSRQLAVPRR